jgi:hypothetical protein
MKALDRFTALMMLAIGIAGIGLIINSIPQKTNTTLIPDEIISDTDYYVFDSEYIYLCKKDSIIHKEKRNETIFLYLDGVLPLSPLGTVR